MTSLTLARQVSGFGQWSLSSMAHSRTQLQVNTSRLPTCSRMKLHKVNMPLALCVFRELKDSIPVRKAPDHQV